MTVLVMTHSHSPLVDSFLWRQSVKERSQIFLNTCQRLLARQWLYARLPSMFFTDYQTMSLKLHSRKTSVRFCLSNGRSWIFAILEKGHNGERTYYESAARHLNKDFLQTHNEGALHLVREMVELIFEWVSENNTSKRTTHSLTSLVGANNLHAATCII